jgi:cell wall-associated NlpC family hydrolase
MAVRTGGFNPGREQGRRLKPTRVTVNRHTGLPVAEEGGRPATPGRTVTPSGVELGGVPQVSAPPRHHVGDILGALESLTAPILQPGHSVTQTARAALNLGVEPRTAPQPASASTQASEETLAKVVGSALGHLVSGTQAPKIAAPKPEGGRAVDVSQRTGAAKKNPADPLGRKTLGKVTAAQLAKAAKEGHLKISKHGIISTPEGRRVLANLVAAHAAVAASGGNSVEDRVGRYLVSHGLDRVGASGVIGNAVQESSLDPEAKEAGTHNGGLWGFTAHPNSLSDLERFAAARDQDWRDPKTQTAFLLEHVSPETIAALNHATSPEQAAEIFQNEFEHPAPATENQPRREEGAQTAFSGNWGKPDHEALINLRMAQRVAVKAGINPVPWNGDVAGGNGQYVYIRADGKGAVDWAQSAVGTQQGSARQLHWAQITHGPEDPWCAEFAGAAMLRQGLSIPEDAPYAGSYLNWKDGTNIGTDLSKLKPGDLVVFGPQGGRAEHVGIYKGDGAMISGNWSDEVAESSVLEEAQGAGLQGIVRPNYKGGKIKVKAGQLPGSSVGSVPTGGFVGSGAGGESTVEGPAASSAAAAGHPVSLGEVPVAEILGPETQLLTPETEGAIARILAARRLV